VGAFTTRGPATESVLAIFKPLLIKSSAR